MEHELFLMLLNTLGEKGVLVLFAVTLGAGLIYVAARVYVAMTPSHDDDEALERGTSALGSALSAIAGLVLGRRKPPAPPAPGVGAALALAGLLALAVGCVPVEAIEHCDMQARNAYGLTRAAPSEDGRGVASDELEAWRWQRIMLTGDDAIPPPGVTYPPLPEPTEAGQ